jgi:hypothetical protein
MTQQIEGVKNKADISVVFDLVTKGPATNIARDKDRMIAEAVWNEHLRKTGKKRRTRARVKTARPDTDRQQ